MYESNDSDRIIPQVAAFAAQWGADQELEACCTWLSDHGYIAADPELRAARRPKPPSLKEQVSKALDRVPGPGSDSTYLRQWSRAEAASLINDVRRALEQLDD
jgi:dienelactone hydrolase